MCKKIREFLSVYIYCQSNKYTSTYTWLPNIFKEGMKQLGTTLEVGYQNSTHHDGLAWCWWDLHLTLFHKSYNYSSPHQLFSWYLFFYYNSLTFSLFGFAFLQKNSLASLTLTYNSNVGKESKYQQGIRSTKDLSILTIWL